MRRIATALWLSLAALAGCGDDDDDRGSSSSEQPNPLDARPKRPSDTGAKTTPKNDPLQKTPPATSLVCTTEATAVARQAEARILQRMNALRAQSGLDPLATDASLSCVSRSWSCAMANGGEFSHSGAAERVTSAGFQFTGENIAGFSGAFAVDGDEIGDRLYELWHGSPGHHANMIGTAHTHVGIGVCSGSSGIMGTQGFGRR